MKLKFFVNFIVGVAVAGITVLLLNHVVLGTANENSSGWPWGGSTDDMLGSPSQDSSTGLGWISLNDTDTGSGVAYGVIIPQSNGPVSGYAWSENLGWINFNPPKDTLTYKGPQDLNDPSPCRGFPNTPCQSVQRNGSQLIGWARFCAPVDDASIAPSGDCGGKPDSNSGGWEGWIKFGSGPIFTGPVPANSGINYDGVNIVPIASNKYELRGYAWSDLLGWIGFGGVVASDYPNPIAQFNGQGPILNVTPTSLSFSATLGGQNPVPQILNIANLGSGIMNWNVSADAPWLGVAPISGTNNGSVAVSVSITNLSPGTYNGNVTVAAGNTTGSPANIPVSFTVSTPQPSKVSCYGSPNPDFLADKDYVQWTAAASGSGNFSWTFDGGANPATYTSNSNTAQIEYWTAGAANLGAKNAAVIFTDATTGQSASANCSIVVKLFKLKEIIPGL